jgi:hypothetical protein
MATTKIAKSDGFATVTTIPANGDPANAISVRRKIVAGTQIPGWLATEGEGATIDMEVETVDLPRGGAAYTRNGVVDQPAHPHPDAAKVEVKVEPEGESGDDELANAKPADSKPGTKALGN